MPYSNAIPQSTDRLPISQPDLLQNFKEIQIFIEVNHETFGATAGEGKHKFVTLPQGTVGGAFPLVTSATEMGIYCKTNGTNPALYVRKPSQTVGVVTNDIDFTTVGAADPGWLKLPSGIIMKWGLTTATGVTTITYPVGAGIPAFATAVYSVQLTPYGTDAANMNIDIRLRGYANILNFDVVATRRYQNNLDTCQFTYLAIGI